MKKHAFYYINLGGRHSRGVSAIAITITIAIAVAIAISITFPGPRFVHPWTPVRGRSVGLPKPNASEKNQKI